MSDDHRTSDGTNLLMEDVLGKISEHGYALRDSFGEKQPRPWTFTIGFTALEHPELVFYNLPRPAVEGIVTRMHEAVTNGHVFRGGDMVDRIIPGFPLAIFEIPVGYSWDIASEIYGYFRVRGLLVISPDLKSRFPWEPGSEADPVLVPPIPDNWNVYDL